MERNVSKSTEARDLFDDVAQELNQLAGEIGDLERNKQQAIRDASARFDDDLARKRAEYEVLRAELGAFVRKNRGWILATFGRTIEVFDPQQEVIGTIKFRIIGRSLTTPKDDKPVVEALLARRGGKRYLRLRWELNRDAIAGASPKLHRALAPLGVWVGRKQQVTIRTRKMPSPLTILMRRYPSQHAAD